MKTIIFYVSKGARRAKLTAAHRAGSPLDIGAPPTKTVLANGRVVALDLNAIQALAGASEAIRH
jgi:hypothetical protein